MNSPEIRKRFLDFFEKRGHAVVPSASLVPKDDASVLFTTAGMQPLVPYLMGKPHPKGKRIASIQKCVRTQDIEEVGDKTHDTFFEMMGNWSLGDYFKKEAITWSYEFLTSKEEGLGLNPERLYITCFEGDEDAPRDDESKEIWMSLGIREHRIYFLGKDSNWWSPGENGPCGPDTEMFYDVTGKLGDLSHGEFLKADDDQKVVEIWNDVFMEYEKKDGKVIGKLSQKNVDTGAGLERVAMVMQGTDNIFDTDLFLSLMKELEAGTNENLQAKRIVADHIRTATFIVADGVVPSNTDQGYILRRLIRRAVRYGDMLGLESGALSKLSQRVIDQYKEVYPELTSEVSRVIKQEEEQFRKTLATGIKEFKKVRGDLDGETVFKLFSTYGLPFEMTQELAEERGDRADVEGAREVFKKHQELSRKGGEQKFKGGLADHSEMSVKYHTATHLLHQALKDVLGSSVEQKGSNIIPERLRFDFSFERKMTDEEKAQVEEIVNSQIKAALPVAYEDVPLEEAKRAGALGLFEGSYGDTVRIYRIGKGEEQYSLEFCGGPHVENTSELGTFKIKKEEAVAQGIRRIKAVLE
ncbi:MAG: alanine--tRNA ligase [Candidatus Paceibacterota bacterium]